MKEVTEHSTLRSTSAAILKTKEVYSGTHFCCICRMSCMRWFHYKMLSYHAHFVLYLLQEIEFILSRTTSCICRFCHIEWLYGRFPYKPGFHIVVSVVSVVSVRTKKIHRTDITCLLYTSPSPRDQRGSRMPSSA